MGSFGIPGPRIRSCVNCGFSFAPNSPFTARSRSTSRFGLDLRVFVAIRLNSTAVQCPRGPAEDSAARNRPSCSVYRKEDPIIAYAPAPAAGFAFQFESVPGESIISRLRYSDRDSSLVFTGKPCALLLRRSCNEDGLSHGGNLLRIHNPASDRCFAFSNCRQLVLLAA
jgi:hypothetical protein